MTKKEEEENDDISEGSLDFVDISITKQNPNDLKDLENSIKNSIKGIENSIKGLEDSIKGLEDKFNILLAVIDKISILSTSESRSQTQPHPQSHLSTTPIVTLATNIKPQSATNLSTNLSTAKPISISTTNIMPLSISTTKPRYLSTTSSLFTSSRIYDNYDPDDDYYC
jgi:hypothetical protein